MAIWQFQLYIVPSGAPTPSITADGADWAALSPAKLAIAVDLFREKLGEPKIVVEGYEQYGDENGCRVDVMLKSPIQAELSARIDARGDPAAFIVVLCDVAVAIDCNLYSPELAANVKAEPNAVTAAVSRSRAAAFCTNPRSFLSFLAGVG